MKWRFLFFNIWPLSVTLTLGLATQLLRSAHCLIMVITCAKLFEIFFSGLKVMEQTRNDGRNGISGHFFCYFLCLIEGQWPLTLLLRNELYSSLLFCLQLDGPLSIVRMDRRTDGQTEAIPRIPFPLRGRGLKILSL
jgi:hypothetical protein